ncbi:helix-hairpin-helix domain-containing protein [Fundicoccus culcitae]|uniref:Helix-hairpin-helix domain-containing protein n=1 Tax=Fundicoccus culcitae TaxID=2969821 RepID=A0ABY5P6T0_9LACT|nr:helix-hairpin-helix domain-containing protein [Fundicoccus culcitae]UUX34291.1 helix-hairpin-helix domain-containing protein [Fundicoccus culcitae]
MNKHGWVKNKVFIGLGIGVFLVVILSGMFYLSNQSNQVFVLEDFTDRDEAVAVIESHVEIVDTESTDTLIYVDIKGAVSYPNMYALPQGSRLFDLIEKAGGFLPDALTNQVNLAQLLDDQMMIYIYRESELTSESLLDSQMQTQTIQPLMIVGPDTPADDGLININSASQIELESLPNIGPKKAEAIIQYRTQNGSFQTIEEILNVSGIGSKTFEQLQDLIKVSE